jgi:hypothetical protein
MRCPTTGIALERREAPGPSQGPAPRDPPPPRSALGSRNLGADRPIARPVRGASQPPRRLPALQPLEVKEKHVPAEAGTG